MQKKRKATSLKRGHGNLVKVVVTILTSQGFLRLPWLVFMKRGVGKEEFMVWWHFVLWHKNKEKRFLTCFRFHGWPCKCLTQNRVLDGERKRERE